MIPIFLEINFGFAQVVTKPTHGNNILDKFFTSRPDITEVEVFASLIKTKHHAVFVKQTLSVISGLTSYSKLVNEKGKCL